MEVLISRIESDVRQLRAALSSEDEEQIDLCLPPLQRDLLDEGAYLSIWDERLLAQAMRLLRSCCGEELGDDRLEQVSQHSSVVRAIHDKLFAILDLRTGIDDLLVLHLTEWPQLEEAIEQSFDDATMDVLQEARSTGSTDQRLGNFAASYLRHLRESGLGRAVDSIESYLKQAIEGYKHTLKRTVYGLFVVRGQGQVYGLTIRAVTQGSGQIEPVSPIDAEMERAARGAVACVTRLRPSIKKWDFQWGIDRDDVAFAGSSIGLALTLGILNEVESLGIDAYTAFTGYVEWDTGEVKRIEGLGAKLTAARELGIRRVFIPRENSGEASGTAALEVIAVGSVREAREWLETHSCVQPDTPLERVALRKTRELEIELRAKGIHKIGRVEHLRFHKRIVFTDRKHDIPVDVYYGRKGLRTVVGGKRTGIQQAVQEAVDEVFGQERQDRQSALDARSHRTYRAGDPSDQQRVQSYISGRDDCSLETEENCLYRARVTGAGKAVFVRQFQSGKLTVSGPAGPLFDEVDGTIRAILDVPEVDFGSSSEDDRRKVLVRSQVEEVEAVELGGKWIGTDESGKGDYYGPLVGAAVLVDERTAGLLEELGVKDSKKLSDNRVCELADQIRQVCGKRAAVVPIPPERYNALYAEFQAEGKNLNTLLAWAHTRALENILSEFPQERITVLVDKFADESYIQSKLLEQGRQTDLNLVQLPKAEANIAVAAASVLARARFLQWLRRASKEHSIDLPKGASDPRIIEVGKRIVGRSGESGLAKVAKLHFKTTKRILARN